MSLLTKGSVMNGKPEGNKSFQERQATVHYTSAPFPAVTVPLLCEATETNKQNKNLPFMHKETGTIRSGRVLRKTGKKRQHATTS